LFGQGSTNFFPLRSRITVVILDGVKEGVGDVGSFVVMRSFVVMNESTSTSNTHTTHQLYNNLHQPAYQIKRVLAVRISKIIIA
jgi:hypothetical protein